MLHDFLRLQVFAAGARAARTGRDEAVLDAIGVGCERSIDGDEAADFETGRIELGDPDGIVARCELGFFGYNAMFLSAV